MLEKILHIKKNIKNSKITILGVGKSGLSAANLAHYNGAKIFISDKNNNSNIKKLINNHGFKFFEIGKHTNKCLDTDLIIKSPGISNNEKIIKKIKNKKIPIISEIEFASWFTKNPIIGVTGSNGKSTTVKILFKLFKNKYKSAFLGGNIGIPFSLNVLEEISKNIKKCIHIVELSSFQLEDIYYFKPKVSCILNLSEDHLDRHQSKDEYYKSKLNIIKNICKKSYFVYNSENDDLTSIINNKKQNYIPFGLYNENNSFFLKNNTITDKKSGEKIDCNKIKLKGKHNYANIIAALEICKIFDFDFKSSLKIIKNFNPLKHRMEKIESNNKITFINDSKATNINSTISAIDSFSNKIILILGGFSKGKTDYKNYINSKNIKTIICYGQEGKTIYNQLKIKYDLKYFKNFNDAVEFAVKISTLNDVVLLSPACSSFDQFNNFEERGDKFKDIINNYNFETKFKS